MKRKQVSMLLVLAMFLIVFPMTLMAGELTVNTDKNSSFYGSSKFDINLNSYSDLYWQKPNVAFATPHTGGGNKARYAIRTQSVGAMTRTDYNPHINHPVYLLQSACLSNPLFSDRLKGRSG